MNLTEQLKNKSLEGKKNIPEHIYAQMQQANTELIEKKIGSSAIKLGDSFPNAELINTKSEAVSIKDSFSGHDFLIISFYRGGWCPYCNIEIKNLQDNLNSFKNLNANLLAITPELPDYSSDTQMNNNSTFEILTDTNSKLSKEIGIAFELPQILKPIYKSFNLDVEKHNGDFTLPIPATFILNKNLEVIYDFIDVDYTKRLDPSEILTFLKKKKGQEVH